MTFSIVTHYWLKIFFVPPLITYIDVSTNSGFINALYCFRIKLITAVDPPQQSSCTATNDSGSALPYSAATCKTEQTEGQQ